MERSKEDNCLLCDYEKAIRTNSHIVPATLLDTVHGKRNMEHSYVFSTSNKTVNEYYGCQNPQEYTTEIKKPIFTYDHILCDDCENYFMKLETLCNTILANIDKEQNTDKIKDKHYNDTFFKEIQNLNPALIQLYFYSIIWRLIIQDYIENKTLAEQIIPTEKKLRRTLTQFRELKERQLKKISLDRNLCLKVVTSKQDFFPIGQFFNSETDNPYFFIAGRFLLYLFDLDSCLEEKYILYLKEIGSISNYGDSNFKIIYFPKDKYGEIISKVIDLYFNKMKPETIPEIQYDLNSKIKRIDIGKFR